MRILLDTKLVESFNSKKLYDEVEERFKEYSINKLAIQNIAEKSLAKKQTTREEKFIRHKSDPTWKATIESEKIVDAVFDFEEKIDYLKTQFTNEEIYGYGTSSGLFSIGYQSGTARIDISFRSVLSAD